MCDEHGVSYRNLNCGLMNVVPLGEAHVANILDAPNASFQGDLFVLQTCSAAVIRAKVSSANALPQAGLWKKL